MKYRNFSEEMQEKDLKEVLEIIYPDTIFCGWKGNIEIPAKCGITAANLLCI